MKITAFSTSFIERRRKEDLAFMIVRFMKAYELFQGIYVDFKNIIGQKGSFEACGLFARINRLEEDIILDIKEKAHFLFRRRGNDHGEESIDGKYEMLKRNLHSGRTADKKQKRAREALSGLRRSIVIRSIDSCVGTGFHLFMILRESLYQLEFYVPQFTQEHHLLDGIESLAAEVGYEFSREECHEIQHLKQLDRLSQTITSDIKERADRAIEQCNLLFRETAEVLKHHMEESANNEVLVLNLLQNRELAERTYGNGALEEICSEMLKTIDVAGSSGIDKAVNFVRQRSGNVTALESDKAAL